MLLLAAMLVLVTVGVFFRYVLAASLTWYDEFASYLLVWLSFYGAVVATYRNRHISFETLAERLGSAGRRRFALVSTAASIVFQGVLCWYGVVLVRAVGQETAVSIQSVRMAWVYSVLPISGGLMLLVSLVRFGYELRGQELAPRGHAAAGAASE
jgi:TRAP-type C4-dicarboxylate transport system permease small subunit